MNVRFGKVEENYEKAEQLIREVAKNGAEIVILPEMWNTGFAYEKLNKLADENGARTKTFLQKLAKELNIHIVGGSVAIKINAKLYNTMYVINRKGQVISEYNKVHLFQALNEHKYLSPGDRMNRFDFDCLQAAGVICYDIRFPEWIRAHALAGAKVIFVTSQWPTERIDHWKTLLQARAIENQCFIVAVNRISRNSQNFNGQSMIIEPWGEVLWIGKEDEEFGVIDVDFSKVDEIRTKIPVYQDRRPELYHNVVEKN